MRVNRNKTKVMISGVKALALYTRPVLHHTSLQLIIHCLVSDDKIQTMVFFFKVVNSVPLMSRFRLPSVFNLLQFLRFEAQTHTQHRQCISTCQVSVWHKTATTSALQQTVSGQIGNFCFQEISLLERSQNFAPWLTYNCTEQMAQQLRFIHHDSPSVFILCFYR